MNNKKWYLSKTVWINVIATAGITAQAITNKEILSPELQLMFLSVINLILRSVTKDNITW